MVYVVSINFEKFIFNDRCEALDFAELALIHSVKNTEVEIKVYKEGANDDE